ncbi:hypothetical protein [Xylella fastidiosa]|uniref:hypothetical protein n=1 Tax=Xylella fastidiosa TaxID=2371 RepID=UPI000056F84D|nr:hypothetical protein [Xylella fastidiosa]ACA12962.1 hypothetical protein Xfasm12_2100 [Xylella fastidiosa M12]ERI59717.1 hypothetical protein M233_08040 [Xylella fastidiosa subsp. multiplex Griffin-1]KFA40541.1 hypothetical protein DF22_002751 [Xylella fastidiosa]MDD0860511.1 hypothetical protein [Xylella fastidiosa subsp. multiplex]MDD0869456.1 hypothetical protein [Xylella fastidiosa subsp. multiplex]
MKGVNLVHDPNAQYEYRCCQSLVMMEVLVNEQGALTALFCCFAGSSKIALLNVCISTSTLASLPDPAWQNSTTLMPHLNT